jgi:hypothetical protein
VKTTLGNLKRIIREALDDSNVGRGGFYDYEMPRGVDVHAFWYRSPGREVGHDGDPGRPSDAHAYIGMRSPSATSGEEPDDEAEGQVGGVDTGSDEDVEVDDDIEVVDREASSTTKRTSSTTT